VFGVRHGRGFRAKLCQLKSSIVKDGSDDSMAIRKGAKGVVGRRDQD
jgi:hypothetical protein